MPLAVPLSPVLLSNDSFDDASMLILTLPTVMSLPPEMVAP